jgi:hypothetical protein
VSDLLAAQPQGIPSVEEAEEILFWDFGIQEHLDLGC